MTKTASIIIPCFNAAAWICDSLESARLQSISDLEVIVIDDGSTDGSADVVAREFPEARLVRTLNNGASKARNLGTSLATGEFIQYLDADDLLSPGKLAAQVKALAESGADIAYGDWQRFRVNEDGERLAGDLFARQMHRLPELELFGDFWCPPAAYLFRRRIVEKVGSWNERLPIIQDARFALDCALHGGAFVYSPGVMALYREHQTDSLSKRDPIGFVRDVYRNASEVEEWWRSHVGLNRDRIQALLDCYGYVARGSYEWDRETFEKAYADLMRLNPRYFPRSPRHLSLTSRMIGYRNAEAAALTYRRAKQLFRPRHA